MQANTTTEVEVRVGLYQRPNGHLASALRLFLSDVHTNEEVIARTRESITNDKLSFDADKQYLLNCIDLGNYCINQTR
jgi:hypothetical protein